MNHSLTILASLCLVAGFTACSKSAPSSNTPATSETETETETETESESETESAASTSCEDMSDCPEGQLCLPGGDDGEMQCMEEAETAAGYDGDTMGEEEEEELQM